MHATSSPRGGGSIRRFFSRRYRRALTQKRRGISVCASPAAAAHRSQAARTRLLDSWSLPELFALRELVQIAVRNNHVGSSVQSESSYSQRSHRIDEATRSGVCYSASSSATTTSVTPPSVASLEILKTQVDSMLVRNKQFHYSRSVDMRLRLDSRRQFVGLFPMLRRTSRGAQRALYRAFDANNTGKIEFEELCEMLAKVKQARSLSVREIAELAFTWFQGDKSEAILSHVDVKLLAITVAELGGGSKVETELGYDLVASLTTLILGNDQHQVTQEKFCEKMDCELGVHALRVLLKPFDVINTLLSEETVVQEVENTRWKAGDMAYVVSCSWWRQWRNYVHFYRGDLLSTPNQLSQSNSDLPGQESGEEQEQQTTMQKQSTHNVECQSRPGPIANSDICANERLGTLRPCLKENEDFVLVSPIVWKRLVQVYGGGPEFPRQILDVVISDVDEMPPRERDENSCADNTSVSTSRIDQVLQRLQVELYPIALQIRLARHDSRHVYLLYARRFLLPRSTTVKEIVHRMGIFPCVNAKEITLWLRRRRLQSWVRLECNLDAPSATLEELRITSAQELLVDFRALDMLEDPQSDVQQRRRISLANIFPRRLFTVTMLQPVGNDFVCCPQSSLTKFARTGDWKTLRESLAAEQEVATSTSTHYAHAGSVRVLANFALHMEASRLYRGRLVQHNGLRATGLVNLGNTCYMNSALQCFVHSPVFREYFLSNRFEDKINKKNSLGSRGVVATAYAQLQNSVWREQDRGYLVPSHFRDEFTRVRRHFEETRQYDAHEFMVALLDCLHEDLNQGCRTTKLHVDDAIQRKSSRCLSFGHFTGAADEDENRQVYFKAIKSLSDEDQGDAAWREYTSVNSSVVVDLFHGQMRSETLCGTCGERKYTFDPHLFFSLPIPDLKFVRIEVSVLLQAQNFPGGDQELDMPSQIVQRGFWLRRGSNVGVLCDRIAAAHGHGCGSRFLLVELRRHRINRIFENNEAVDKLATLVPGSLAAYERAWTLAEIPVVPASVVEYFNKATFDSSDANTIVAEKAQTFFELRVGSRVGARDNHNAWHLGTVIEVSCKKKEGTTHGDHFRVCVHFDAYSRKWNKWFTARDWKTKRLQLVSKCSAKAPDVFEVQVVHRFAYVSSSISASEAGQTSGGDRFIKGESTSLQKPNSENARERLSFKAFGTPLFVTIASDKTAKDMHHALLLQTARFWRGFNDSYESVGREDCKLTVLPYEVRVVNLDDLTNERGEPLPMDSSELLQHFSSRSVLALDWVNCCDYSSNEVRAPEVVPDDVAEAAKTDSDLRAALQAGTRSEELKDGSEDPALENDDDSPPMYAIPLTKCMDALMREEVISLEDHWVCERCNVPREGTRSSAIWRLPDLVMVQLKRFQYLENQHNQKVRALVDFPLQGLDFSKWMGHQNESSSVYDLYAVANHVGGLTRGHYTACCRYDKDFPESSALFQSNKGNSDVQCTELWFRFDDEKVSEIALGDVVTDAAYVLFYKRRTLSPHNVVRYAL